MYTYAYVYPVRMFVCMFMYVYVCNVSVYASIYLDTIHRYNRL